MSGRTDEYLLFVETWMPKDADPETRRRFVSQLTGVCRAEELAAWQAAEKFRGLVVESKDLMTKVEPVLVEVETRLAGHGDPNLAALSVKAHNVLGWKDGT